MCQPSVTMPDAGDTQKNMHLEQQATAAAKKDAGALYCSGVFSRQGSIGVGVVAALDEDAATTREDSEAQLAAGRVAVLQVVAAAAAAAQKPAPVCVQVAAMRATGEEAVGEYPSEPAVDYSSDLVSPNDDCAVGYSDFDRDCCNTESLPPNLLSKGTCAILDGHLLPLRSLFVCSPWTSTHS